MKTILSVTALLLLFTSCTENKQNKLYNPEYFDQKNVIYEEHYTILNDSTVIVKKSYIYRNSKKDTIIVDTIRTH